MFVEVYGSFESITDDQMRICLQRRMALRWFDLGINQVLCLAAYVFSPRFFKQSKLFGWESNGSLELSDFWVTFEKMLGELVGKMFKGGIEKGLFSLQQFSDELIQYSKFDSQRMSRLEKAWDTNTKPSDELFLGKRQVSDLYPALRKVASHILGLKVQTATVEKLFRLYGLIKTKRCITC